MKRAILWLSGMYMVGTLLTLGFVHLAKADGVITTGNIQTTNGPVAVIQIYETNGVYEVQFNPNNISNGWQTIYTTTNFTNAVSVLRRGLASVTNTVQNTK